MKKIKNSTKIFAFLGLVVVTVVIWQTVLASRIVYDRNNLEKVESMGELTSLLKGDLKTYKELPVNAFSEVTVENGVCVYIIKADRYGVYQSSYLRKQVKVYVKEGKLSIISRWKSGETTKNTPLFVLMPQEPEIYFKGGYFASAEIYGFDGRQTKVNIDSVSYMRLNTNMEYANIEACHSDITICTSSRFFAPIETADITVWAKKSNINLYDSLSKKVNIKMEFDGSRFYLFVHERVQIGNIHLQGSLHTDNDKRTVLGVLKSDTFCDSLVVNLRTPEDKRYEFVVSEGFKPRYEEVNLTGKIDVVRR